MKKRLITLFAAASVLLCTTAQAQGFASLKTEGAITETFIKDRPELSLVETIVLEGSPIANMPVKYKMWSGCSFEAPTTLTTDYTKAQYVTITKDGEGSKKWVVAIHQLKGADLPLNIKFSTANPCDLSYSNPKPWASYNLGDTEVSAARLSNTGSALYVAYNSQGKELTFDMALLSKDSFGGEFIVESSADAKSWKQIAKYTSSKPFAAKENRVELPSDARFVRFVYELRQGQNIHLNNITVK